MNGFLYAFQSLLSIFGLTGLWLAGKNKAWGWLVSLGSQVLWAAYLIITGQYLLMGGTIGYAVVYTVNFVRGRRRQKRA